jgi:hypothetical protein
MEARVQIVVNPSEKESFYGLKLLELATHYENADAVNGVKRIWLIVFAAYR